MPQFKVNQKVICIEDTDLGLVKKGEIKTISKIVYDSIGNFGFHFYEVELPFGYRGFLHHKFKPLDENFADETLSRIAEQIKEESLILV